MDFTRLQREIINKIINDGPITFASFMELSLYHSVNGYYTSDEERIGRRGDYYTSSDVHPQFGQLIARQLEQMWRLMGREQFTVVEMGAGKGLLCYDIMTCINRCFPEFFQKVRYRIVELNKYAIAKQVNILKEFTSKISWESFTVEGFSFESVVGCFLSNEFVDSLPVHRLIVDEGKLKEIYVGYEEGKFYEIVDELSCSELEDYVRELPVKLQEGQKVEANLRAVEWIKNVSRNLSRGFVITIDYGYHAEDLYSEKRSEGTLICYHKHRINENPFARVGDQDITSHVNFSSLINTGMRYGLNITGFTKQSHFLIALGILERVPGTHQETRRCLAIKNLILPGGMGDVFKVLIQHKGLHCPELTGLRSILEIEVAREMAAFEK